MSTFGGKERKSPGRMKFIVGKSRDGSIPRLTDGLPAFAVSECGRYTLSRIITGRGVHYEGWLEHPTKPNEPTHLLGSYAKDEVVRAIEAHASANPIESPSLQPSAA